MKRFSKRASGRPGDMVANAPTTGPSAPKSGSGSDDSPSITNLVDYQKSSTGSSQNYRQSLQTFVQSLPSSSAAPTSADGEKLFDYLQTIGAVRDRCNRVFALANSGDEGSLRHFTVNQDELSPLINGLVQVVKRDFGRVGIDAIPPHGRWQHLEAGGIPRVSDMIKADAAKGQGSTIHTARRVVDLFVVSVLLDAGAGNVWSYKSGGQTYRRSEGLAVASYDMFASGAFSSDSDDKLQVDAKGLRKVDASLLSSSFQVSGKNTLDGLEGRAGLLNRLANALEANPQYFGATNPRPGNMIDFILGHEATKKSSVDIKVPMEMNSDGAAKKTVYVSKKGDGFTAPLDVLWEVLIKGFRTVWPEEGRERLAGKSLGDVWTYPTDHCQLPTPYHVPFHKLTQWMCYSLMAPISRLLKVKFEGEELMTGLPEYRNGGLLIDSGLLRLKDADLISGQKRTLQLAKQPMAKDAIGRESATLPTFSVNESPIIEWRAVTVGFLDYLHKAVKKHVGEELTLAQFLEAASWKTGREYAEFARPTTKSGPILIESDGTVF